MYLTCLGSKLNAACAPLSRTSNHNQAPATTTATTKPKLTPSPGTLSKLAQQAPAAHSQSPQPVRIRPSKAWRPGGPARQARWPCLKPKTDISCLCLRHLPPLHPPPPPNPRRSLWRRGPDFPARPPCGGGGKATRPYVCLMQMKKSKSPCWIPTCPCRVQLWGGWLEMPPWLPLTLPAVPPQPRDRLFLFLVYCFAALWSSRKPPPEQRPGGREPRDSLPQGAEWPAR